MNKFLFIAIISLSAFISADEIRKVTYTNFQGELIEDVFGIGSKTYFYEDGKLVKLTYQDKEGKPIPEEKFINMYPPEFRYSYDARGNYIRKEAFNASGEVIDLDRFFEPTILSYVYNDQNQLIEKHTLNKEGKPLGMKGEKIAVNKYAYDEAGNLISIAHYDESGNALPYITQFSYLPNGQLSGCNFLKKSNESESEIMLTYNDQGLLSTYNQVYSDTGDSSVYHYEYIDSVLISEKSSSSRLGDYHVTRGVKLNVKGWMMRDSLLLDTQFQNYGRVEFNVTLNSDGNVMNLEPIKVNAWMPFVQEVYQFFRTVKFERVESIVSPDSVGKLSITIPHCDGVPDDILFIQDPTPND